MAFVKKFTKRGFTLIELMIVVVIIGILASLAIYGVQKYVANSKSAEAKTMLGRISKDMLTFFEGENQTAKIVKFGDAEAGITQSLCEGSELTPTSVPNRGKGMPAAGSFKMAGWVCTGTSWSTPTYYSYQIKSDDQTGAYTAGTLVSAQAGHTFTAVANGNLDGDTELSTFRFKGEVVSEGGGLALVLATTIEEIEPEE